MIRLSASNLVYAMHCLTLGGRAIAIVWSAFEQILNLVGAAGLCELASGSVFSFLGGFLGKGGFTGLSTIHNAVQPSGFDVIQKRLNSDDSTQSGRCRHILAPT